MEYNRRRFLKLTGISIGASAFAYSCKLEYPGYYFFTEGEAKCVIAFCEQIIPADDDPGATDAGVIYYIDKQLISYFSDQQETYRKGIAAMQQTCNRLFVKNFEDLAPDIQIEFMHQMEKGDMAGEEWEDIPSERLFRTMLNHAMQGFYGSPRHGGNKDYMSYTMMGVEYPLVIGENRYRETIQHTNSAQ